MITVALILILVTASISGLQSFSARAGHIGGARVVLGALEEAHARTLASDDDDVYGVHFETDQVILFKGTSYTSGDPDNDARPLPARTEIASMSLGGGDDVLFERLTGNASPTGTVTISDMHEVSASSTVTIYATGLSEISN